MSWLLVQPWPWWLSALGLSSVVLLIWGIEKRLFGVSGSYARIVRPGGRAEQRAEATLFDDPNAFDDALMRATLEQFGPEAVQQAMATDEAEQTTSADASLASRPRLPWTVHLVLLAAISAGASLAALLGGYLSARPNLGVTHAQLFGDGWPTLLMLVAGGALVGFGTRMAGGCTSGHGLVGCARFAPASLSATVAFFGSAVLLSLLLAVGVS